MPSQFVLDNSVVMAWCFEDEGNGYAQAVLESLEFGEALAPAVWPLEVGNTLVVAERRQRLSQAAAARFLMLLNGLPISVEQESPGRMLREIVSLARAQGLSTYDASYLDLAMRLALPLATQDAALAEAARQCAVPLLAPDRYDSTL